MRANKGKDTGPELVVRRMLHAMGYRFRLHRRDLPGTPDIVFPSRRKAIQVHGCFWHGHGCKAGQLPKSRLEFWRPKIDANRERDERNLLALQADGWAVAIVWSCELRDLNKVQERLFLFLGKPTSPSLLL
jgi:DNA mismatch endonuclease (patch repair protein)